MFNFIKNHVRIWTIVLLFVVTLCLFSGSVLNSDDIYYNFFDYQYIKLFNTFFYGTWIMTFQNFLMYYIPFKLDINLQSWALSFGVFFKSIVYIIIVYVLSLFCPKRTSKPLFFISTLLIYFLSFILFNAVYSVDLLLYSGFFRFVIPAALGVIYFYFLFKLFKTKRINLLFFIPFVIFSSSSSELMFQIVFFSVFTLLLYNIFSLFKNRKFANKTEILSLISIFIASIVGFSLLYFSTGFQQHINSKLSSFPGFYLQLSGIFPFLKLFIQKFIINFAPIYVLMFILFITSKSYAFNQEKRQNLIFSFIPIISVFLSAMTFFFMGKTSYSGNFWLDHNDIYSFYIPILLVSVSINFRLFFKSDYLTNLKKGIVLSFCTLLFVLPFYLAVDNLRFSISEIKRYSYLRDKIRIFYAYRNEQPITSDLCLNRKAWILSGSFPLPESSENQEKFVEVLERGYYRCCYKLKNLKSFTSYKILSHNELIDKFISDGGSITEFEKNHINFEFLEDKDFVLNQK